VAQNLSGGSTCAAAVPVDFFGVEAFARMRHADGMRKFLSLGVFLVTLGVTVHEAEATREAQSRVNVWDSSGVTPTALPMPPDIAPAPTEIGPAPDAKERIVAAERERGTRERARVAADLARVKMKTGGCPFSQDEMSAAPPTLGDRALAFGRAYGAMLLLLAPPAAFLGMVALLHRRRGVS
jgi:hypothetical protein